MRVLFFIAIMVVLGACYSDDDLQGFYSDEYYLRSKGADLPVWVRGNQSTNTFIFFIHGGPLVSGLENAVARDFEILEQDYALVYYDQRGGGYALGNRDFLNESQMVEDLDLVIQFVKEKYTNASSIFLMGHSWGGYLGTKYLSEPANQSKVNGWIELAGAHNPKLNWQESRKYILNFAEQKINSNNDEDGFWQTTIDDLDELDIIDSFEDIIQVNWRAQRIEGEVNEASTLMSPSYIDWATSPTGPGFKQNELLALENILVEGNLNPVMPQITLPSLLIYGESDAIVPSILGDNGYEFLGTPETDKFLIKLPGAGHDMWRIALNQFADEIETFVEKYN